MGESIMGITDTSEKLCQILLETEQPIPQNILFRDDLFFETCEDIRGRNKAMVVRDISPLRCPSLRFLKLHGYAHLNSLYESVNKGWNCAHSIYGSRLQPDYSIGFGRSVFTDDQLEKLKPFVGDVADSFMSYFMATWQMYFPFLTYEVKCSTTSLDVADRQNAHSIAIALRAVVDLLSLVKREKELHREILGFSYTHDHETTRIFAYYAIINGGKTTFHRRTLCKVIITERKGRER